MKKHLLFLPDIFLVLLILFSCERIDLSEWRKSTDSLPYTNEKVKSVQGEVLVTLESKQEAEVWKDFLTEYKDKAKSLLSHLRVKIGEN